MERPKVRKPMKLVVLLALTLTLAGAMFAQTDWSAPDPAAIGRLKTKACTTHTLWRP